jgi:MOSC domain-containing protein YiiM
MSRIDSIFVTQRGGGRPVRKPYVTARAGLGLDGDRHQGQPALFPHAVPVEDQLTLIEAEALDALLAEHGIALGPGEHRRNFVTRGVRLNDLVGRTFRIGAIRARGVERCDPCLHLEQLTKPGVLRGLVDRGGLRAEILTDGVVHEGDPLTPE